MKIRCTLVFIFSSLLLYSQPELRAENSYARCDSVAALYPRHSLKNLDLLVQKLTYPFHTESEKFRTIYKWVCNNIENDYRLYKRNKKQREILNKREELKEWNFSFSQEVFKVLHTDYRTICTGYSWLLREMSRHAGIECKIINGYGRNSEVDPDGKVITNHSWNAVQLNKKWYLCDPTWSSGVVTSDDGMFSKDFEEGYYLTDPKLFALNHYPQDTTWMFLPAKPTLEHYLHAPLAYRHALHYQLHYEFPESFEHIIKKNEEVIFQFSTLSGNEIKSMELEVDGVIVKSAKFIRDGNRYKLSKVFRTKGKHTVNLMVEKNYAFTFLVNVK